MTPAVFLKLLAIFTVVTIGWLAGRAKFFGGGETARALSNAAFYLFAPALLFRTTARIDFATLPWAVIVAYFVPVVGLLLGIYVWRRRRLSSEGSPAEPSVRAITATFSNTVQLGIPIALALFGEAGLSIHLAIVSLHALILLSLLTVLVELDMARAASRTEAGRPRLAATLKLTVRNTLIHPVVLPVLVGMGWNVAGLPIPQAADEILSMLGQAVVPVCLVAIGMSLAHYGLQGSLRAAGWLTAAKLVAQPALVLVVGRFVFGLSGLPLTVIVICAALPAGTNALMFSQRYRSQEAETTATLVLSTLVFVLTAPLWLALVSRF
ncbi:AEC family transporter [Caldimonas sp.]|uniref:AEC family transporter n=1 Tax=Caldimonas sp. TaxID=2838790 RepID=UPI00391CA9A2